jgi:DNA processing protein
MSTLPRDDLKALVLLSRTPGIRAAGLAEYFEREEKPSEILNRIATEGKPTWREALEATRRVFDPEKEISKAEEQGIEIIALGDERYPFLLKESSDPPLVLYVRGSLIESDQAAVALVGSRHPTPYGREQAKRFGQKLAAWGLTVVSGFARGIDRAGHEAALEVVYGRTIAVLGSGLDVIYPREHEALYEEIRERGALVSEFSLGTPPLAENFPKRNRIIAGLSLGVLVVEAHSRSGSLITAHLAADEGREVFALPNRVDQLGARGTHRLIKEGAALVESPDEILEALVPRLWPLIQGFPGSKKETILGEEEAQLLSLFEKAVTADEAARRSGKPIYQVVARLTSLELKGLIRRRFDGRFERLREKEKSLN